MGIKLRNLDPELKGWIMAQTNLGPCIGDLFYVAPTDSSTSHYRDALGNMGVTKFYPTVTAAYNATTAYRNDIVLVAPGAYDEAASIDWSKDNTHLIGLGGPNTKADYSEKNAVIYTDTAAVDYTIHLTGDHCQFINIGINNAGANAGNFSPLYVDGYGNYFENVGLIGNMAAEQLADADCASLIIGTNAHNCKFINCDIGEDCWGARSGANSGQVLVLGSQPNGILFRNCFFRSRSETATCAMVATGSGSSYIGRSWVFDNCIFSNFYQGAGINNVNEVFHITTSTQYWPVYLKDCYAHGYDRWTDEEDHYYICGNMAQADDGGGLDIQLDTTVGGAG